MVNASAGLKPRDFRHTNQQKDSNDETQSRLLVRDATTAFRYASDVALNGIGRQRTERELVHHRRDPNVA